MKTKKDEKLIKYRICAAINYGRGNNFYTYFIECGAKITESNLDEFIKECEENVKCFITSPNYFCKIISWNKV